MATERTRGRVDGSIVNEQGQGQLVCRTQEQGQEQGEWENQEQGPSHGQTRCKIGISVEVDMSHIVT